VRIAVVGAGPAGSTLAAQLARDGADVSLFDHSHPREKPCGGGITRRALDQLPRIAGIPARWVESCRFESEGVGHVELRLECPIAVVSRRELDAWLLERAVARGATHLRERVVEVGPDSEIRTSAGRAERFDVVIGADGASSLVRRRFLTATPSARRAMAVGWYTCGETPMLVRFLPTLAGYMWLFPRTDHVAIGICAPLGTLPSRALFDRLDDEVRHHDPRLAEPIGRRYARTVPAPSTEEQSILEIAGPGWALVGDAAALADPITGEGIAPALRSATLLAETLRETASTASYPERVLEDFGRDLNRAALLRNSFFAPGFTERMLRYSARSQAIRTVLGDLVLGRQDYLSLKRRLLRAAPRFAWQSLTAPLSRPG
jgi:flavin-dependent dehydrogenase